MPIGHLRFLAIAVCAMLINAAQAQATWVLEGAKIYPAPDMTPINGGKVVIAGTKIKAIPAPSDMRTPAATRAPECNGGIIVAGFQNSHVHFTSDEYLDAAHQPAEALLREIAKAEGGS